MNIVALSGGLSSESSTHRLTERLLAAAAGTHGMPTDELPQTRRLNVRELGHDLVNMATTGMASPALEDAMNAVLAADGVIAVTPVYNAAPMGLFTLFLQLLPQRALAGTPVLLAATGGSARHSLAVDAQVRPLVAYLKGLALPTVVFAATDDWGAPEAQTGLQHRIGEAAAEFRRALRPAVAGSGEDSGAEWSTAPVLTGAFHGAVVDGLDPAEVTPFEQLLKS